MRCFSSLHRPLKCPRMCLGLIKLASLFLLLLQDCRWWGRRARWQEASLLDWSTCLQSFTPSSHSWLPGFFLPKSAIVNSAEWEEKTPRNWPFTHTERDSSDLREQYLQCPERTLLYSVGFVLQKSKSKWRNQQLLCIIPIFLHLFFLRGKSKRDRNSQIFFFFF